ncbi:MAG: YtxH domain-containing protein [Anaerolineaceae bacterium]|jgi:gas vesicle protein
MSKFSSWITGAFWGALVGSAVVLLYTPYSGKEMQDKVCGYLNNVKDEVQRAGEEKRAELEERLALLQSGKI